MAGVPGYRCAVSGYGKRSFERNYDSDICETSEIATSKRFKIQTGDIRSPLTGPRSCATSVMSVVNLKKEV